MIDENFITKTFDKYAKKEWTSDTFKKICVGDDNFKKGIEDILHKISVKENKIIQDQKIKIASLEAKVYTYEKIIANSNFAPILKEK